MLMLQKLISFSKESTTRRMKRIVEVLVCWLLCGDRTRARDTMLDPLYTVDDIGRDMSDQITLSSM